MDPRHITYGLALGGNEKITVEDLTPLASLPLKELDVVGCKAGLPAGRYAYHLEL